MKLFLKAAAAALLLLATAIEAKHASASHILVKDEAEAKDILAKINAGESFETWAKAKSTCPSGQKGGSLGDFAPGAMVPAFDASIFGTQGPPPQEPAAVGKVVGPIKTQFGWHLIRVDSRSD